MNASGKVREHSPCLKQMVERQKGDGVATNTTSKENSPEKDQSCSENQNQFDTTDFQEKSDKFHSDVKNEHDEQVYCIDRVNHQQSEFSHVGKENILKQETTEESPTSFLIDPQRCEKTILEEIEKHDEQFSCVDRGNRQQTGFSHNNNKNILGQEMTEENQTLALIDPQRCGKTLLEEIDALAAESGKEINEPVMNSSVTCETQLQNSCLSVACVFSGSKETTDKENRTLSEICATSPKQNGSRSVVDDTVASEKLREKGVSCTEDLEDMKIDFKLSVSIPLKEDPFSLSADEDFSPKTYRPVQRKTSMCQDKPKLDLKRPASPINKDSTIFEQPPSVTDRLKVSELSDDSFLERKRFKPSHQVVYIHNKEMVDKTSKLWRINGRANLVHSLINVYGILQYIDVLEPRYATESEILGFHCQDYLNFLKGVSDDDEDNSESVIDEAEDYGLSYDCPLQKDCFRIASLISGGTITAAEALCDDRANIAINWCGGWHHAKRDSASGFCYLNDIVLGILKLRQRFDRVLYIDIDLHHGDGVEEAFYMTPKVMTVSFHKYAPGFFPGSGNVEDIGTGRGKYYTVNVPLMDGIKDNEFFSIFTSIMKSVKEKFNPEAVVMQCGADTLAEDPMLAFNLTHVALARCVCFVLTWNLPTLLLGGGGYHFANTAKCWTFITAIAAGKKLPIDIPEHENFSEYGPSYELTTLQGYRKNCNSKEYLHQLLVQVHRNLSKI